MTVRSKVAMLVAEFLGTAVLATAAINVARSQIGIGYFVAFSVAITFATLVLIFGRTSGGHFNPAVTIGMWTLRRIQTAQALAYLAVQMLGGLAAWRLAEYLTGQDLASVAPKGFDWKILVAEVAGTFIFTFGFAAAVYQRFEEGRRAATMGAALFVGTIVATIASNGALNPAIALANQSWERAYIFGPIIGAVLGMNLYALLFAPERALVANIDSDGDSTVEKAPVVTTRRSTATATTAKRTTASAAKRTTTAKRKTTTRKRK